MTAEIAVAVLNRAFAADPAALHALVCNHVPCNQALADDPTVVVESSLVRGVGGFHVGALGLINGILGELGLPLVAAAFSAAPEADGRHAFVGFCAYTPATEAQPALAVRAEAATEANPSEHNVG